jgi:hypothetical protein
MSKPRTKLQLRTEKRSNFSKNFTQILSDSISKDTRNQPVGVPCVVWLHPLVLMKDDAPTLSNEISHSMASECVRIIQDYKKIEEKIYEMLAEHNLSPFREKFQNLHEYPT